MNDTTTDATGADEVDVHAVLAERRQIAAIWSTEDVLSVRPDLTDDQAWAALRLAERTHDANCGINWEWLGAAAESLFGPAPEEPEPAAGEADRE